MTTIERHITDSKQYASVNAIFEEQNLPLYKAREVESINYIINEFGAIRVEQSYMDGFFNSCYLFKWQWAETFLHQANALNRVIFELSFNEGKELALIYNEESVLTQGQLVGLRTATNGTVLHSPEIYNCWYWRDVAHVAMLLRDSRLLALLQAIPTEEMFVRIGRYNTINPDGIDYYWHELYLQILADDNQKAVEICADMIQKLEQQPATYVKNVNNFQLTRQRLEMLTLPYLRCVAACLSDDQTQFSETLYEALRQHKAFCELPFKKSKQGSLIPNSNVSQLFVSIPLLAICSLAYDRGLRWDVTSDYTPQWLIERDYRYKLAEMR